MNYQISRAGQPVGTYDIEALKAAVLSGQVLASDLAWTQGMAEWKPVSFVLTGIPALPGQASAIPVERIREVASNHRAMNLCLLLSIVAYVIYLFLAGSLQEDGNKAALGILFLGFALFGFGLFVFWCIKVYKLADALQAGPAFLWLLGMFVPCLNYVFVLILSQKAGNFLKASGVKVGFLGADTKTLP